MNKDKLARLQAQVRTGGKGSVRRKKKAVHKTTTTGALLYATPSNTCDSRFRNPSSRCCRPTDDKRLQNTLKRLGVNTIPGIEEVNLFKVRESY